MTVVFTAATPFCIVTASDSAVSIDDAFGRSYELGRKCYSLPGVGVVTTWGARDGNQIGQKVSSWQQSGEAADVTSLARCVDTYLREDYQPSERDAGSVGYHVAGFTPKGIPKVYHAFYNPSCGTNAEGGYEFEEYSPGPGLFAMYNGRDDIVQPVVALLTKEIQAGRSPMKLDSAFDLVALAHLTLRFAREVTFEVSPPFKVQVMSSDGNFYDTVLPEWEPLTNVVSLASFVSDTSRVRHVYKLAWRDPE